MDHFLSDPKSAVVVLVGTVVSTLATVLEVVQPWLSALATGAGALLSLVLAYSHWKRGALERQKLQMEIEHLRRQTRPPGQPLPLTVDD